MNDIQQDIGDLKATVRHVADGILEVKRLVEKNNDVAQDFRDHATDKLHDTVTKLATIEQRVMAISDYQIECEVGRKSDGARISQLEGWQNREAGAAKTKTAIIAGGSAGAVAVLSNWDKILEFFRHM